jgi:hypothetical protein
MDNALLQQVRQLRDQGKSPKQIARTLGLAPAAVTSLVRTVATQHATATQPQIIGCWINNSWSVGLTVDPARGWDDQPSPDGIGGLVSVLVARKHRWDKVSMCGYLTDVYCLGVKKILGPEVTDELGLRRFLPDYYGAYPHGWQDAPIDLARHLVFGAVDYARSLGFEPTTAFAHTADHLGSWQGPSAITFGKNGKPFYMSGPHDNPHTVITTLERAVGSPPNFDYVIAQQTPFAFTAINHSKG